MLLWCFWLILLFECAAPYICQLNQFTLWLKAKQRVWELLPCLRIKTWSGAGNSKNILFRSQKRAWTEQCNSKYVYQLLKCCNVQDKRWWKRRLFRTEINFFRICKKNQTNKKKGLIEEVHEWKTSIFKPKSQSANKTNRAKLVSVHNQYLPYKWQKQ